MESIKSRVCLVILDGWGRGRKDRSNAIFEANTPFADSLDRDVPFGELRTDGEHVGLPEGQMGNSEVGHMNIGAGRIVYQDLVRINLAVRDHSLASHPVLHEAIQHSRNIKRPLHLMGLVSDGGVHSHIDHLLALCDALISHDIPVCIHAFTDGRDTDPRSGIGFLRHLEDRIRGTKVEVVSVIGRYYAMDRDKRWERIKKAYDLLVNRQGEYLSPASYALERSYEKGITDEFVLPYLTESVKSDTHATGIQQGDAVLCFNFRTDRCREITQALTQQAFPESGMTPLDLHYVTMTNYDDTFRNVRVIFDKDNLEYTLGEVIAKSNCTQVRIAETEKYPHVTFFFSGGREKEFPGESRIMIHSPKVATYDLQPDMSAPEVADAAIAFIRDHRPDFVCLNFANADMVGHTGVFEAIVKAVETVDHCLQRVVEAGTLYGYSFVIIADHGNADYAVNEDGTPNTAHTTNPVPVWIKAPEITHVRNGILADVAPTILKIMGLEKPDIMTGTALC